MKKITLATFKSWMRKNQGKIFVNVKSSFDGMTDGCEPCRDGFKPASQSDHPHQNNLGINGIWLVLGGGDYFTPYYDAEYCGIEVSNCCGRFIVAITATVACQDQIADGAIGKDGQP